MRGAWPADEIRAAEHSLMATLAEGELMRRAAYALHVHCARLLGRVRGTRIVVLVGAGNNGGDALYAGAQLAYRGADVRAVLLDPVRAHRGGLAALRRAGGRVGPADPARADLVLDGILGIGGRGGLRGDAVALADAARASTVVAVDLPSGVDADTGAAGEHTVQADVTVTFGALKPGLIVGEGAERAGEVRLADIGLRPHLPDPTIGVLEQDDLGLHLPGPTDDKYTRGVVGVIAGSAQYPGAGVLCTGAALHGGSGMVRYLGGAVDQVRARYPEVVVDEGARPQDVQVQAWVVGPGMGTGDAAHRMVRDVLATDVPVIVDADGITVLADLKDEVRNRTARTVLTPHDREFARIAQEPGSDRIGAARHAAADLGVTLLLKGNATVVAEPDGTVLVNPTGTPWLATAGSGDVLSGLIGSLLAAGVTGAAAKGAFLHGLAGQLAALGGPPSASDVLEHVRAALRS